MENRGNVVELARVQKYLKSGEIMREESLGHSSIPCEPVTYDEFDNIFYHVPSTGAIVALSASVSLINFYCSRLPSDGYGSWKFLSYVLDILFYFILIEQVVFFHP